MSEKDTTKWYTVYPTYLRTAYTWSVLCWQKFYPFYAFYGILKKRSLYRQHWFKWSIFIGGKKFQPFELWNYQFRDIPDILWKKLFVQGPFCIEEGGSLRRAWISDFNLENVQNELKLRTRKKWIDLIFESIRNSRN